MVIPIKRKSRSFSLLFWSNVICQSHPFLFGLAEEMVWYWEEEKTPFKHKQGREATRFAFTWYLSWKIHQKLSSHIALTEGEERNFSNSLPEQKDWKRNTIHVIIAYLFIYSLKFTWSCSQIHNHLHSNPSFPPIFYGLLLLLITPPPRQSSLESKYFGVNLEKEKKT